MIKLASIPDTETAVLHKVAATLKHMLDRRFDARNHLKTRKKKFPKGIDFKSSGNGHFNKLQEAVAKELGKRTKNA